VELQNVYNAKLSLEDKTFLKNRGFVHLPGLLDKSEVEKALRVVNIGILEEGALTSRVCRDGKYDGVPMSWSAKYTSAEEISQLCNSSKITGVIADLFGVKLVPKIFGAQIALVFPDDIETAIPLPRLGYHIDGEPNHKNEKGFENEHPKLNIYNALVGVYLKDIPFENHGNFTIYPGSHQAHADYFREFGPDSILNKNGRLTMPKVQLEKAHQCCVSAGDVVIANYLTGHTIACHVGHDIRYALYFRVSVTGLLEHRIESLCDPWYDWSGLAGI